MSTLDSNPRDASRSMAGAPRCGACGHDLTGAVNSAKCPECGRPIVEVLVREGSTMYAGRRYRSRARIGGMPCISVAFGPGAEGRIGHARGWIALGDRATGMIAIGGFARGVVALGGMSLGVFTFGGLSMGLLASFGGVSIAPLGLAYGGLAAGLFATGGVAFGLVAMGGVVMGTYGLGPPGATFATHPLFLRGGQGQDPQATALFQSLEWLVGRPGSVFGQFRPIAWLTTLFVCVTALLGLPAILRWRRETSDESEPRDGIAPR